MKHPFHLQDSEPDMDFKAEARRLRKLAFVKDIELRKIAEDLGYHPAYVSNVLRWQDESKLALDRIREYLEGIPSSEPQLAEVSR